MAVEQTQTSVDDVLDAVDSALVLLARLMDKVDFDTLEKLLEVAPKLEKFLPLLEKLAELDPEKLDVLLGALDKAPELVDALDKFMPLLNKLDTETLERLLDKLPSLLPLLDKVPELEPLLDKLPELEPMLDKLPSLLPLLDKAESLEPLLDKVPVFVKLLDGFTEEKVEALGKLMDLLPVLAGKVEGLGPCIDNVFKRMEDARPVGGLRGLLGALRDKEVQEGLGKVMEALKALGSCKI